jgi:Protein of unknown function (DUF1353)
MDGKELARLVAADLGHDVVSAVENPLPPGEASRTFGAGLTETMAVASFLASSAQLAIQIWQVRQDRALLVLALAEGLDERPELASQLDPEKRLGILARLVNKLVPERFGSSPSLTSDAPKTKQQWVSDWLGLGGNDRTRAMTSPVLMPFADMDNFVVYTPIYWTPPDGAPANLPRSITVPSGFVTDLATIPPYFWWAIRPTGRHGHAAILHDWLYWEQIVSRAVADRVFEVAMAELAVDLPTRKAIWAAVRVGGGEYWTGAASEKKDGKNRVIKRLPDKPVSWKDWSRESDVFA